MGVSCGVGCVVWMWVTVGCVVWVCSVDVGA